MADKTKMSTLLFFIVTFQLDYACLLLTGT